MKITKKDIDNFNRKIMPSANEEWNKAHGIYNRDTYLALRKIKDSQFGIMNKPLTMKHVKEWQDYI